MKGTATIIVVFEEKAGRNGQAGLRLTLNVTSADGFSGIEPLRAKIGPTIEDDLTGATRFTARPPRRWSRST